MIRKNFTVLILFLLAGALVPLGSAIAQDKDRPRPFKNLPPQERRQAVEKFRQERIQNPQRFPGPEQQQQPREEIRSRGVEKARQADTNRDGALSREEAGKSFPRFSRHFDEADTNHDGVVSPEEMRAFREKRRQQRMGRGDGDPRN